MFSKVRLKVPYVYRHEVFVFKFLVLMYSPTAHDQSMSAGLNHGEDYHRLGWCPLIVPMLCFCLLLLLFLMTVGTILFYNNNNNKDGAKKMTLCCVASDGAG